MSLIPVLATGLSGLVGSRFVEQFQQTYQFQNMDVSDPTHPVNILDQKAVLDVVLQSPAQVVIHMAAYTDVNKAWEQRNDKNGIAYQVNVVGTRNLAAACQQTGKHLIHISTAFVFNGQKNGLYTEQDPIEPIEWYGETKAWAEEEVQKAEIDWTILRIDQPFRTDEFKKPDTVHRVIAGLKAGKLYPQFTNHFFGPTWIDDLGHVLDWTIKTKTTGIFHASSGEQWTDYDFAVAIKESLNLPGTVEKGNLEDYLKTTQRPYHRNTAMSAAKILAESNLQFTPIRPILAKVEVGQ